MSKQSTLHAFLKRKSPESVPETLPLSNSDIETPHIENPPTSARVVFDDNEIDIASLERDPGLRPNIWDYPIDKQDEIRRWYIKLGPLQPLLQNYPKSNSDNHPRSF
jgi:hypothetical protein